MSINVVAQLERERGRLLKQVGRLNEAIKAARTVDAALAGLAAPVKKRRLTEAGRQAIAEAQRRRHQKAETEVLV